MSKCRNFGISALFLSIRYNKLRNTYAFLRKIGYEIVCLPVDKKSVVSAQTLKNAITKDTRFVSVILANNEIGTIEPIKEPVSIAHQCGILFHIDAVQAVGHIPVDVNDVGIDLLSASAHKFNGPKGIGFLYIREGVEIEHLLHGGGP